MVMHIPETVTTTKTILNYSERQTHLANEAHETAHISDRAPGGAGQ